MRVSSKLESTRATCKDIRAVGLEIGSQSVPEIAISIVAELIARRNLGPKILSSRTQLEFVASAAAGGASGS